MKINCYIVKMFNCQLQTANCLLLHYVPGSSIKDLLQKNFARQCLDG